MIVSKNDFEKLSEIDWECVNENTSYLTHNMHPYHSKYIPQIAGNLIDFFSRKGDIILDNFCGSGTTLIEAELKNRNAIGVDINPLACLISKVKTTPLNEHNLKIQITKLLIEIKTSIDMIRTQKSLNNFNKPIKKTKIENNIFLNFQYISLWFQPQVIHELTIIKHFIDRIGDKNIKDFSLVAFSSIIREVSNASSEFGNLMVDKKKRKIEDTYERFEKKIKEMEKRMIDLSNNVNGSKIEVIYGDTRNLNFIDNDKIDLIVTHPPYIAAVPYAEYQKLSLRWLGFSDRELDNIIIGGKRQNKDVVERFNKDMQKVFDEMFRVLKNNKVCCVVIGNPVVRGKKIELNKTFVELARNSGFKFIKEIKRGKYHTTMGKMKEEFILFFEKSK